MNRSDEKYRLLIKNLPEAFAYHQVVTDSKGKPVDYIFMEVNAAFEEMTGLKREEILGKKATAVLPGIEKDKFDWIGTYDRVALSGEPIRFESFSEPLGRWYDVSAYSDEPGSFVALFRDISEQKKNEHALIDSEEIFKVIANYSVNWESWFGPDGKYLWVNSAVEKFTGYSAPEILDMSDFISTLIAEEDRAIFKDRMSAAIGGRQGENFEFQYLHKNGTKRWLSASWQPLFDAKGNFLGARSSGWDITERKRLEQALSRSEERFQKMLSLVPDMISIHDTDMNIIYSNWNGFGAVPAEKRILNTKCYNTYRDLDQICPNCQVVTVLQTGEAFQKEVELFEGIWVDLRVIPILGEDQNVEFFVEWVRDITDRKVAEAALLKKEALQNLLMTMAAELINIPAVEVDAAINRMLEKHGLFSDLDRVYIFHHDNERRLTTNTYEWCAEGITPEINKLQAVPFELLLDFLDIFHRGEPVHIPSVAAMPEEHPMRAHFEEQSIRSLLLLPLLHQEVNIGFVGFDAVREEKEFTDTEVSLLKVFAALLVNIEKRREGEQGLILQKERLANIVEGANVGTWEWNVQTGETVFNERWAGMIGYTLEELAPVTIDTWIKYCHPDDLEKSNLELEKHYSGEVDFYNVECRMKHKDGHWIWVNDRGKTISWTEDGEPLLVFGTHIDITDRKKTEEALKLQARERAAVDTFTYSVSNDLQAPLRRIEGFSEALLEECHEQLNERARDYLTRIITQIGSMKALTDALLQLSRVVSREIDREAVNLSALTRSHLAKLRYHDPERRVETVVAPELIAKGDADLLNILLNNLVDNAWKFTSGAIEARIELGYTEKNGRAVYYLKDNGIGFDMNHADKLFTPFHKLHSEEAYPGIGIGLNLVYRIIARHGGEIWAESEPGKGACFCFTLP